MAKFLRSIIFFILLVLLLTSNSVDGKIHVRIYNTLVNDLDLTIHCKSKDDDLGVQLIHPLDAFEFSFNNRESGETLFFCSFKWKGAFKWFDIYKDKRDGDQCVRGLCYWNIKQDSLCMINGRERAKVCYPYH